MRLSVSDLESFRYWKAGDDPDPADLIARLKHEAPPTPQMEAGHAFARLFEESRPGDLVTAESEGWSFDFSQLDASISVPPIRELKGEMEIATPYGLVTLVGKVDGLYGKRVHDQKLTERWDAEKYTDSLQWRAYLTMFDAWAFTYDVFLAKYDLGDERPGARGFPATSVPPPAKWVEVREYHAVTFYAYPEMRRDVERAVCELAGVVAKHIPEAA